MLIKYLQVLFISMLPIIELRGAIPFATAIGVPPLTAYGISIIGNMLPIPFIFLFAGKILHWGKDKPYIGNIFTFFLDKGYKAGEKLENKAGFGLFFALILFVGIPLPGTGAWTGSLAACLLGINARKGTIAVLAGVLLAGIIMMTISLGALSIFK